MIIKTDMNLDDDESISHGISLGYKPRRLLRFDFRVGWTNMSVPSMELTGIGTHTISRIFTSQTRERS